MISFKTQDVSSKYGLILNTSSPKTQVGLYHNNKIVAQKEADVPNDHTRDIINYIDQVLASLPIKLDYIAAVVGPGSYTGIRIGIATAQGLALPFKTKLVALSILEALALQSSQRKSHLAETILISTYPAKNNMVYYQAFNQDLKALVPPSAVKHDEIMGIINDYKTCYHDKEVIIVKDTEVSLETLGQLACHNFLKEEHVFTPLYINQPDYCRHNSA